VCGGGGPTGHDVGCGEGVQGVPRIPEMGGEASRADRVLRVGRAAVNGNRAYTDIASGACCSIIWVVAGLRESRRAKIIRKLTQILVKL
jgi:hypothetical protein